MSFVQLRIRCQCTQATLAVVRQFDTSAFVSAHNGTIMRHWARDYNPIVFV
jgi:hypothetical protein